MGSNGYVKCRYQLLKGFMWRDAEKNCCDTGIFKSNLHVHMVISNLILSDAIKYLSKLKSETLLKKAAALQPKP